MNYGKVSVIIPAHNEELSIGKVLDDLPDTFLQNIIVINNNSTDSTKLIAQEKGAIVLDCEEKGYGISCLTGIKWLKENAPDTDIVVFLDGDYSDYPEQTMELIQPIIENDMDMVIGSRANNNRQKGSMTPQQIFGNWLATFLIRILYGANFTDLGPFRAIRFHALLSLKMKDRNYGWTVEMQLKAAQKEIRFTEIPVKYRPRIGQSKVSGTVKGTIMAGYKILFTIFKYLW